MHSKYLHSVKLLLRIYHNYRAKPTNADKRKRKQTRIMDIANKAKQNNLFPNDLFKMSDKTHQRDNETTSRTNTKRAPVRAATKPMILLSRVHGMRTIRRDDPWLSCYARNAYNYQDKNSTQSEIGHSLQWTSRNYHLIQTWNSSRENLECGRIKDSFRTYVPIQEFRVQKIQHHKLSSLPEVKMWL